MTDAQPGALYAGRKDNAMPANIKPIYPVAPAKLYGIPEMTVQEEMNLPANMRQTLSNKITMIEKCSLLQQALDQVKFRAKHIPLLDDDKHAAGVQEMTDLFMQAYDLLWSAALHGIR